MGNQKFSESKTLLFIEPEEHYSYLFKDAFAGKHTVIFEKTGANGIEKYREIHQNGQYMNFIVILDVTIIDLEWREVLQSLYQISPTPNIIVIDQEESLENAIEAFQEGATSYLVGMLSPQDIQKEIDAIHQSPVNLKKIMDISMKDKTTNKDRLDDLAKLVVVKVPAMFAKVTEERQEQLETKPKSDYDLFDTYLKLYNKEDLSLKECRKVIETHLKQKLSELPKAKLLVVDNEGEQELVELASSHYTPIVANNTESALNCIEEHSDLGVALFDVDLNGPDGPELYIKINELKPDIATLVITNNQEIYMAKNLIQSGAYNYLSKNSKKKEAWHNIARAWLRHSWPTLESKFDMERMSLLQRLYLLNYMVNCHKKQRQSIVFSDVLALFPEFIDTMEELNNAKN